MHGMPSPLWVRTRRDLQMCWKTIPASGLPIAARTSKVARDHSRPQVRSRSRLPGNRVGGFCLQDRYLRRYMFSKSLLNGNL